MDDKLIFDSIMFEINGKQILKGVYLKVETNNITGLCGLNGCGKSTLMKIGIGEYKANSGNVFIDDALFKMNATSTRFPNISYLSQDSFLPKDLTVKNIIEFFPKTNIEYLNSDLVEKIYFQDISSLSAGELRYLELKLLFSLDRKYYLLDEPFTGIEPKIVERIIEEIKNQKNNGKGILLTDHYFQYISKVVDNAYLLKDGYCKLLENVKDYTKLFNNRLATNQAL